MHPPVVLTGLVVLGLGTTIVPRAIANEMPSASLSMADLDLPTLDTNVANSPAAPAPQIADVLPAADFVDVPPTHWAYGAVNSLAENYGCLSGYPDGTFRGDEFVTRYEFAAAMDVCLGNLLQLVESPTSDASVEEILTDLTDLQRELGSLESDVDAIAPVEPEN